MVETKENHTAKDKLKSIELKTKHQIEPDHKLPSYRVKDLPAFGEWWKDLYGTHKQACIDAYKEDNCLERFEDGEMKGKPKTWKTGWNENEKPYYYDIYKQTLGVYDPKVEEEFELQKNYQASYVHG